MDVGTKKDEGKMPFHLIPPEALYALTTVLKFGAKKYTKEFNNEWERLLSVPCVEKIKITTALGSVEVVMKNILDKPTLSFSLNNKKMQGHGQKKTPIKLKKLHTIDTAIRWLESGTKSQSGKKDSLILGLPKRLTKFYVKRVVKYVGQENSCTLTIVTKQENSEVSYAVSATTALDSLEMIWLVLKEQLGISKPLKISEGNRNWEKGMAWSRLFSASMRHMWCWWAGKGPSSLNFAFGSLDDETGFSHLWHALACIVFLVTYEERQIGEDDRP